MGFYSEFVHVHTVRCDACRKEATPSFHRIVAVANAKRQKFERLEVSLGENKKEVFWFCAPCLRKPKVLEQLNICSEKKTDSPRAAAASS